MPVGGDGVGLALYEENVAHDEESVGVKVCVDWVREPKVRVREWVGVLVEVGVELRDPVANALLLIDSLAESEAEWVWVGVLKLVGVTVAVGDNDGGESEGVRGGVQLSVAVDEPQLRVCVALVDGLEVLVEGDSVCTEPEGEALALAALALKLVEGENVAVWLREGLRVVLQDAECVELTLAVRGLGVVERESLRDDDNVGV